ncbi:unnamed protein product [Mesocestoides corti]|uniref:UPF0506 domain-containing protein n=1 Tax=Mesocestoides corti TaxID=53468 RepID=A0A0R3UMQ5_MESCO|nr:unnamed protein product [Mesocestoides corti]
MGRHATMKFYLTLTVLLLIAFAGVNGQSGEQGETGIIAAAARRCALKYQICFFDWECCSGDCAWYRLCR